MKTKITIIILTLCVTQLAFGTGAGGLLIATSEALEKEVVLWSMECGRDYPDAPPDVKQKCANDKRTLVKRLLELDKFCDQVSADMNDVPSAKAAWKLQGRAARFYVKYPGVRYQQDAAGKAEAGAIVKERARLLKENPDGTFAKIGLLSQESIEWLTAQ
jgi:hypothetical protein